MNYKQSRLEENLEEKVKAVGFFDIETYRGFSSDIATIGFKELGKEYQHFEDSVEFVEFLKDNYLSIRLFGYNSGRFDTPVLLESLRRKQYPVCIGSVVFSGSSINALQMDNIVFKDLILAFGIRFKLSRIAKDFFGEDKKDFDASNITEFTEKLVEYNKQDVVLTEKIYNKLLEITNVKISTAASMSMAVFEKQFQPDIKYKCAKRGIRDTYKGGRVEIFKFAGNDVNVYDVNSEYPYVMKENPYPVGLVHRGRDIRKEGYSFAVVRHPYSYIPYLGLKTETKLLFPYGSIHGYFTNYELRQAKSLGAEVDVIDSWLCDNTEYLFEPYVNHFYNARKEAKERGEVAKEIMYKTFMNCLYGKFGQRIEKDKFYSITAEDYDDRCRRDRAYRDAAEIVFKYNSRKGELFLMREKRMMGHIYHDYILASYVTAYARNWLYSYFRKAGLENIYYCDTDSIFTTSDLSNDCGAELGLLKKEKIYKEYKAYAPKLYMGWDGNQTYVKAKGFRHIRPELMRDVEICGAKIWSADDYIKNYVEAYKAPAGMRESARRNDSFFQAIERKRSIVSSYDKREILENGDTKPLCFSLNM